MISNFRMISKGGGLCSVCLVMLLRGLSCTIKIYLPVCGEFLFIFVGRNQRHLDTHSGKSRFRTFIYVLEKNKSIFFVSLCMELIVRKT